METRLAVAVAEFVSAEKAGSVTAASRAASQVREKSSVADTEEVEAVEPATKAEPKAAPTVSFDDDGPAWPDSAAESAFLAEQQVNGGFASATVSAPVIAETVDESAPLPSLDELVKRIPAEARETLEDLFRARFVGVKRVPQKIALNRLEKS